MGGDIDHRQFGDDGLDAALGRQGQGAAFEILGRPSRVVWEVVTMTPRAFCASSMPPPMPGAILPGMIQLARSPSVDTSRVPKKLMSTRPPG